MTTQRRSCDRGHTGGDLHCITCGDEAVKLIVLASDPDAELATCVSAEGELIEVDTGLLPEAQPGMHLLVHAGTAIAVLRKGRLSAV